MKTTPAKLSNRFLQCGLLLSLALLNFSGPTAVAQVRTVTTEFIEEDAAAAQSTTQTPTAQTPPVEQRTLSLFSAGAEPNIEAVRKFLIKMHPGEEATLRTKKLINQLGSADFSARRNATEELVMLLSVSGTLLNEGLQSDDPETAFRCRQIIKARNSADSAQMRMQLFDYISANEMAGLLPEILAVLDGLISPDVRLAAIRAIGETAREDDAILLRELLNHEDRLLVTTALETLVRLNTPDADSLLQRFAESDDDSLRLTTADLYARQSRAESLDIYLRLMASSDNAVRSRAYVTLRRITGQKIPFSAWDKPAERDTAIATWREWVNANRDTIEIDFLATPPRLGRLLVSLYSQHKVLEFDMTGKQLWEAPLQSAFACQGLPNGHRLVSQYSGNKVVEYDRDGAVFKEFDGLPGSTSGVMRLDNGNTLVAAGQADNLVRELGPDGETVWEKKIDGVPMHAALLDSGNLLVSLNGTSKVAEVDRTGKVIWEIPVGGKPYFAKRLPDGNTLVAISDGGIKEFAPDGTKVREIATADNLYSCDITDDGNFIFADNDGVHIVTPDGKVVFEITDYKGYLYLNYY